jgi:outer membrane murein-binding lipoprotein Lpp
MTKLPAITAALLLAGCATAGRDFDVSKADQLRPGVSTVSDAVALLGPYSTETDMNGMHSYGWNYAHATAFGGAHAKMVVLTFGPDGKLRSRTVSGTSQ